MHLFFLSLAFAGVPVQGTLFGTDGSPATGTQLVTFTLTSDAAGSAPVWSDAYVLSLANGAFAVDLGSGTVPLADAVFTTHSALWMTVSVAGSPPSAPVPLGRSAYAVRATLADQATNASNAAQLGGQPPSAYTYSATGAGLQLSGTEFSINHAALTPSWSNLQNIPSTLVAGYTAGTGLQLSGGSLSINPATIPTSTLDTRYVQKDGTTGSVTVTGTLRVGNQSPDTCPGTVGQGALRWDATNLSLQVCTNSGWRSLSANGSTADGSSAANAADTCETLRTQYPHLQSGHYWIDSGTNIAGRAFCDFDTTGGPWTIGVFQAGTNISNMQTYKDYCTSKGFAFAGRGAENVGAWLAQKRHLWRTQHMWSLENWPNTLERLVMPVMKNGSLTQVTIFNQTTATLPANLTGDTCNGSVAEHFCGYWYNNGWSNPDQTAYPDPEDFGPGAASFTWFSCIYK